MSGNLNQSVHQSESTQRSRSIFTAAAALAVGIGCLLFGGHLIWASWAMRANADGSSAENRLHAEHLSGTNAATSRTAALLVETKNIEHIQVGERVYTEGNPTGELDTTFGDDVDPATWRRIALRAPKRDG